MEKNTVFLRIVQRRIVVLTTICGNTVVVLERCLKVGEKIIVSDNLISHTKNEFKDNIINCKGS